MSDGQGSISYNGPSGGSGGGQAPLSSTGNGVPVFTAPSSIASLKELSGVRIAAGTGPNAGDVTFFNRLAYFFVDQFGAAGDGTTDDTAAIQAAFTAAGANGGGVVFFPKGSYLITATIDWPVETIWAQGSGSGRAAGPTLPISEILVLADGVTAFSVTGDGCKITDLSFAGPTAATSGDGVNVSGATVTVRDCVFTNFYNGLVQTNASISVVDGCEFFDQVNFGMDTSNSVNADDGDCVTSNCAFFTEVGTQAGWHQQGSGGQKIHGCKFVSNAPQFVNCIQCDFPDSSFNTSDLLVSNCSIEQFTGLGIVVTIGVGAQFFNIVLVGNQIGSYQGGKGIQITASGGVNSNNVIVGNAFNQSSEGIILVNVGSTVISGNLFDNVGTEVVQAGTNTLLFTGLASNDQGAPPVNAVTPAAWADYTIYSPSGSTLLYKIALYQ